MTYSFKAVLRAGLTAGALMLSAAQAQAATFVFTLTGAYNATWQLNSSPVPNFSNPQGFSITSVTGMFGGVSQTKDISFLTAPGLSGGLSITTSSSTSFLSAGPQLFSGTTAAPTFLTGTFALSSFAPGPVGSVSLTIAPLAAAPVPEPATWAMMIAGFGLVGGVLRHGRQRVTVRYTG